MKRFLLKSGGPTSAEALVTPCVVSSGSLEGSVVEDEIAVVEAIGASVNSSGPGAGMSCP